MNGEKELLDRIDELICLDMQMRSNSVPSKRNVKHQGGGFKQPNSVFRTAGPGSSRSVMLDMMKAISSESTGCVVVDSNRGSKVPRATTSRNDGNVIGGYQLVQ